MGSLVGRDEEQRALEALVESANGERSAVLVLRGEPGIGKTALLDAAAERADGMRVLRCAGIEAEHELAFAGVHQLVRPCLDLIDELPAPQAAALRSALGLSLDSVEDRFLVSLGLLSLLAEYAEAGPVLCLIDDAQWLDRPSAEALLFAVRRLEAEPIAILIAAREGELRRFDAQGLPELELGGIADDAAGELLRGRLGREPSADVLVSLVSGAAGNPLALLELPAGLTERQLAGGEPIVGPPRARGVVEQEYRARIAELPEAARRVLLLAAADEAGDVGAVTRAAERLGGSIADLEPAAAAGLARIDEAIEFRHPLVRSAAYRSALPAERAAAHMALAAAVDDTSRSVWHKAAATEGADEALAAELTASAEQAAARGAQATAAAAFERAAELSEDPERRAARLARAAGTSMDAGRLDTAIALAERARPLTSDPGQLAGLQMVRAMEAMRRGSPLEAHSLTMTAGVALGEVNPDQARTMLLWSLFVAFQGGWGERVVPEVGAALRALAGTGSSPELERYGLAVVEALEAVVAGEIELAQKRFEEADRIEETLGSVPFATLPAFVHLVRGEFAAQCEVVARKLAEQRVSGSVIGLAGAISLLAGAQVFDRRLRPAVASVDEGLQLARQFGYENDETGLLALRARIAALQGREADCRDDAGEAMRRSLANGVGWATLNSRLALAELELGLGKPAEALAHLGQLDQSPLPPVAMMAIPDLVDAAVRLDERERAAEAVEALRAWAPLCRASMIQATLARCRALLADGGAEGLFTEALELHRLDSTPFERARTELAYGEWLRRERRKTDARTRLRNALDIFEGMGTALWAERARGELRATGETARKRDPSTVDELTPQELRIAQLVGGGATNRDVAAQLFVSPKTVEYHLRKVFMKLGVTSRVELAGAGLGDTLLGTD